MDTEYSKHSRRKKLTTTKKIMLGFILAILTGTFFLMLPVSVAEGKPDLLTAFFTSATSVCVNGLEIVDTFSHWTLFGKIIILILIQLGGLGIVAFTSFIMLITRRKVGLQRRMEIQDAYGLNNMQGLVGFVKKVLIGTFITETLGTLLYMPEFCKSFGIKGAWYAFFNSVSAFCNAGINILPDDSLMDFSGNSPVLIITMILTFLGGVGFVVWWDVQDIIKKILIKEIRIRDSWKKLRIHTKLVLTVTLILFVASSIIIFLLEYDNPNTIGQMSLKDKIINSMFESVTLRSAGFVSFDQAGLRDASTMLCLVMMVIGGSPVGTAGGIKTVTVAVLVCAVISVIHGRNQTVVFNKSISDILVKRSLAVFLISLGALTLLNMLLMITNHLSFIDSSFEACSAIATVGITRGVTAELNTVGKLLIIVAMYLGRIGPISMFVAFSNRYSIKNSIHYAEADIIVG